MAIYDFFLSRNNAVSTPANYIGHKGRLFYNGNTGEIRLSDGSTPGGIPIPITLATTSTYGGIKLGPGATLNGLGQLVIDPTGLDFAFGDFQATTETSAPFGATLSSVNSNQDINIVSNGTGNINVIGEFSVYKPDTTVPGAMTFDPIFTVKNDGQIQMLVPGADSTEGALNIVGGLDGVFQPPVNTGVMLHITGIAGTPGVPSRVYNDAQNAFAAFVARRYNNTAASPSAVLANEEIMRLSGTAHNGTIIPGINANQRIVFRALGNQSLTNQGGSIEFWTTPLNTTTLVKIATVDNTDGITSTKFTGPLFGNVVATTVTATNLIGALSPSSQIGITQVGTLTNLTVANTVTSNYLSGKLIRGVRDAGTIGAGGTLTIDFATDSIVKCVWSDGMTLSYQNFLPGRIVKVIATKATGSGTDSLGLDGVTASQTSNGSTSITANADTTVFIECYSTTSSIAGLYIKL